MQEGETGTPIKELCRKGGFGNATLYKCRAKFAGMAFLIAGGGVN